MPSSNACVWQRPVARLCVIWEGVVESATAAYANYYNGGASLCHWPAQAPQRHLSVEAIIEQIDGLAAQQAEKLGDILTARGKVGSAPAVEEAAAEKEEAEGQGQAEEMEMEMDYAGGVGNSPVGPSGGAASERNDDLAAAGQEKDTYGESSSLSDCPIPVRTPSPPAPPQQPSGHQGTPSSARRRPLLSSRPPLSNAEDIAAEARKLATSSWLSKGRRR
ncbi:hypothetical protein M406DRAFT_75532 [Cryphonectria parasitica EP155]|uniref:Uncharacterized protein n=1 Tax=Cryphonectria parasitica (strain ATCC 38755 / EP155) TaxID=660469 RepID=A0A9P5CSJ3_CRYP1|nr:uncharacterized protein M406DRAFT_75532 [Cryphonectria parasitica EP155]KAF3768200.1 hypothetical protein M406DRAFT_75532 [Cryphonectria parasitica EP155]